MHRLLRRHQVVPDSYLICSEPPTDGAENATVMLSVVRRDGPLPVPLAGADELVPRKETDTVLDWATIDRTLLESDRAYVALLAQLPQLRGWGLMPSRT